jgi:hypothetical protein
LATGNGRSKSASINQNAEVQEAIAGARDRTAAAEVAGL